MKNFEWNKKKQEFATLLPLNVFFVILNVQKLKSEAIMKTTQIQYVYIWLPRGLDVIFCSSKLKITCNLL